MTCHNRKRKTLLCLESLFRELGTNSIETQVYLVDSSSTDGTAEAVHSFFPEVNLIVGDDSLFWCGGMRVAFAEALKENYEYYLWLNDDTMLLPGSVDTMLQTACKLSRHAESGVIIVGSCCDPNTGERTYGGEVLAKKRLHKELGLLPGPVIPSNEPQACDDFNGNCVLISRKVAQAVGNLSPAFTHALGDSDYGRRACEKGFSCWVAPGYIATCNTNNNTDIWYDSRLSLRDRWKRLHRLKGLPPKEWAFFVRRHEGKRWPVLWMKLYLRVLFPSFWSKLSDIKNKTNYSNR